MSESDPGQVRCTPTDPSIEFDLLEAQAPEKARRLMLRTVEGEGEHRTF